MMWLVGQLPRLTFHFAVELRSFRAPRGIENQKSPARLQQSPKRIEQHALLCVREMTQEESDQGRRMGIGREIVGEEISVHKIASIENTEAARFRSRLSQHPLRLIEQGDAGTVRRVVTQPVRRAAG